MMHEPPPARARSQAARASSQPPEQPVSPAAAPQAPRRTWRLHLMVHLLGLPEPPARALLGYLAAGAGVTLVTLAIGLVTSVTQVGNLSLIYLLVVLWLAVSFGRGPAIVASFLAFLAYDFFFVPPFHRITVDDPAQWIALLALLGAALVIGQLTATVQTHAREARASQQRMERLYTLAELIASTTDERQLLQALVEQVAQVFAPSGVAAAALLLPDAERRLSLCVGVPAGSPVLAAFRLDSAEQAVLAHRAFQQGAPVGLDDSAGRQDECCICYVPLWSGHQVVGVLGIAGTPDIRQLVTRLGLLPAGGRAGLAEGSLADPQVDLFTAFCRQIALALERTALQRQAVHAEALRESDRLKNVLLGSVTHDLRTPLAAIKASTTSLLEPGMSWRAGDWRELIESVDASVDRLSHLVNNVLDLSQLEAGAATPQKDWHLIGDVIATALSQLERAGQSKGRQIVVEAPETLPLVPLDHAQIERVLINLLENALKFSPPESVVWVQARVAGEPPALEVRVSDQGVGIPAGEVEAIFSKFYRRQGVRLPWANGEVPGGTGLGLAICAGIVRAHGGRIWAESQPGEGATLLFTLPIPTERPSGGLPELPLPASDANA